MSELKYKVGDRVLIKSIDWWNNNNDNNINESIRYVKCKDWNFIADMKKYCGKILTIEEVHKDLNRYRMSEDKNLYSWTDEMIECKVEDEIKPKYEDEVNGEYYSTPKYLVRPSGYQFVDENGNVINATKIVLEKKKKEVTYPKTYEECCEIFQYNKNLKVYPPFNADIPNYDALHLFDLLEALRKLLIARDAYWKIAGEEMGLGKPWENGRCEVVYGIYRDYDDIVKQDDYWGGAHIFEFPTREMRDAFKENFDPDIEICKEFL